MTFSLRLSYIIVVLISACPAICRTVFKSTFCSSKRVMKVRRRSCGDTPSMPMADNDLRISE